MAKKPLPTPEELRQLLRYEPETGRIFLKCNVGRAVAGEPALTTIDSAGRLRGRVGGRIYLAHRVAFALHFGRWPGIVDHIDGDPTNNILSNLRECAHRQNMCNRKAARNSSSKYLGVSHDKRDRIWRAEIRKDGKSIKLGSFAYELSAARAYDAAAKSLHGEFARLNFKSPGAMPGLFVGPYGTSWRPALKPAT